MSLLIFLLALSPVTVACVARRDKPRDMPFTAAVDGSAQCYAAMLPKGPDPDREYHILIALHDHGVGKP